MIFDTDVLIWYMRGNERAADLIATCRPLDLSAVTYMELVQGMRNKKELQALRHAMRLWGSRILPITEEITYRAMHYVEEHFLSHSLRLAVALIAATAVEFGVPLCTANTKHYRVVRDLQLEPFSP
ncbi:PIN domain-containing protein [Deferrisoma palaeochoriense]